MFLSLRTPGDSLRPCCPGRWRLASQCPPERLGRPLPGDFRGGRKGDGPSVLLCLCVRMGPASPRTAGCPLPGGVSALIPLTWTRGGWRPAGVSRRAQRVLATTNPPLSTRGLPVPQCLKTPSKHLAPGVWMNFLVLTPPGGDPPAPGLSSQEPGSGLGAGLTRPS